MSITSNIRKAGPFTGNGITTSFPFAFKVFNTGEVLVVQTDVAGVETTLSLTTDYTVTLNADQDANPGGTVDMITALPVGLLLTLTSSVDETQSVTLTNQGGFYPTVINDALDRLTIITQQILESLARKIGYGVSDTTTGLIPAVTERANKFLAFDSSGNVVTSAVSVGTIPSSIISDVVTLRASTVTNGEVVQLKYHTTAGDGGGGHFRGVTGAAPGSYTDNNGTIIVPTGGDGSAAWLREFNGAVDIRWFGANPSLSDNTANIQASLDFVFLFGGGVVYIPSGTYLCLSPIRLRPMVSLLGSGKTSVIDSKASSMSIYSDENISFVRYEGFTVSHASSVAAYPVSMMVFNAGVSRSFFNIFLNAKASVTGNGLTVRGTDPTTGAANNNQYGNVFEIKTTSLDTECNGIALSLQSDNTANSRQNANEIRGGCRLDGFATGLSLNGNGNLIGSVTFNGPATNAAIYLHGDGCFGNAIISPYIDSAVTGATIKTLSDSPSLHMFTLIEGVKTVSPALIVDISVAPNSARYTILNRSQFHIARGGVNSVFNKGNTTASLAAVGAIDDVGLVGIASPRSGGIIVSGENYSVGVNSVSNAGGVSASIGSSPSAEFRVVSTNNGNSYTKRFSITSAGAIRDLSTSNGPVGTFNAIAASSIVINNTSVTINSRIFLFPNNSQAALVQGSSKFLYISNKTAGVSFTVATADGTNITGFEQFQYLILN